MGLENRNTSLLPRRGPAGFFLPHPRRRPDQHRYFLWLDIQFYANLSSTVSWKNSPNSAPGLSKASLFHNGDLVALASTGQPSARNWTTRPGQESDQFLSGTTGAHAVVRRPPDSWWAVRHSAEVFTHASRYSNANLYAHGLEASFNECISREPVGLWHLLRQPVETVLYWGPAGLRGVQLSCSAQFIFPVLHCQFLLGACHGEINP